MLEEEYSAYSLERTVSVLAGKYPRHYVLCIRPARVQGFYSSFDHLLQPGHTILHLQLLLHNALHLLRNQNDQNEKQIPSLPIRLLAFSRGMPYLFIFRTLLGVEVLNSFFAEYAVIEQQIQGCIPDWQAHSSSGFPIIDVGPEKSSVIYNASKSTTPLLENSDTIKQFVSRIVEIDYLDGHRYPSNPIICSSLAHLSLKVPIYIHLTPRQKYSEDQKFIGKELAALYQAVEKAGGFLRQKMYLHNAPKTLHTHFNILLLFEVS